MLHQIMNELIERIPHLAIATLHSERYYRVRCIASLMREYFIVGKVILSTILSTPTTLTSHISSSRKLHSSKLFIFLFTKVFSISSNIF